MIGKKFGKWEVVSRSENNKHQCKTWLCKCDCGTERIVSGTSLRTGQSNSCGCVGREKTILRITKHGMSRTPVYHVWQDLKKRCTNSNYVEWRNYGGRGITVCDSWLSSFDNFFSDMGGVPFVGAQLDRINNNGNYEPSNCRWVSSKVNNRNKRTTVFWTLNGVTLCVADWANRLGVKPMCLWLRVKYRNWTIEQALTTPVQRRSPNGSRKDCYT